MELKNFRIEGIYPQRQDGYFMQRVKLPAGVISAVQARCVADVAELYGRSSIHLTTRGSMEIHWLKGEDLPLVRQKFAMVGLTSRGACGGAVRGISCYSQGSAEFPCLESMARRLQCHFTGNPLFEGLPKKFKIGIEADAGNGRHLIQDAGLVLAGSDRGEAIFDLWIAGGLGREPRAGFLLLEGVREGRVIPFIEAVIAVYARLAPPPKRLKFLAAELGEDELRRLIEAEPAFSEKLPPVSGFPVNPTPLAVGGPRLAAAVFAGQLTAENLRALADFADLYAAGQLQVSADQDIAFLLAANADAVSAAVELKTAVNSLSTAAVPVSFRICPGSHECRLGLAPTREIAAGILKVIADKELTGDWAISGCPNSCSQPQLATTGIMVSRLVAGADGERAPLFDLYRRHGAGFGERVGERLSLAELRELIQNSWT